MNVLLLYPTWTGAYGLFGHFARRNSTWPPLNLALLAAIAERHGHNVTILDGESEQQQEEEESEDPDECAHSEIIPDANKKKKAACAAFVIELNDSG